MAESARGGSHPRVSFVIPVRNDAARLDRCLASIMAATYPPDRRDILVVDNGSTDRSAEVARRHGARVLSITDGRVGELRNRAAQSANGDVLAFVDADHEIAAGWIEAAVETMRRYGAAAVGAAYWAPPNGTWVQGQYDRLRRHPDGQHPAEWLGSGNLAVDRQTFLELGGFDTTLETCEDVDLCRRLLLGGHRVFSDSRLHSIHHGDPSSLSQVFRGETWRGRDNIRVSLRPPRSWRGVVSALIPAAWLAIGIVGVIALLTMSRSGAAIGLAAVTAIGLLIAARAVRMLKADSAWSALPQALLVAAAYDLGRMWALVARAGYGRRRRSAV